jgi:feruloyl esterase
VPTLRPTSRWGPFAFDVIGAIDQWVESGRAPNRIVVSNPPGTPVRTRLLCPFPEQAIYSGMGSTDDEKSFRCEAVKH